MPVIPCSGSGQPRTRLLDRTYPPPQFQDAPVHTVQFATQSLDVVKTARSPNSKACPLSKKTAPNQVGGHGRCGDYPIIRHTPNSDGLCAHLFGHSKPSLRKCPKPVFDNRRALPPRLVDLLGSSHQRPHKSSQRDSPAARKLYWRSCRGALLCLLLRIDRLVVFLFC